MPNLKLKGAIVAEFGCQARAAKVLGITERRLSRLIHGFERPRPEEAKVFEEKLGVSLEVQRAEPGTA